MKRHSSVVIAFVVVFLGLTGCNSQSFNQGIEQESQARNLKSCLAANRNNPTLVKACHDTYDPTPTTQPTP